MAGITTVVTPVDPHAGPGRDEVVHVTFTTAPRALNAYTGGQLTWTDGTHTVRIPIVIRRSRSRRRPP